MHALLVPFGSHGDVHPFIGLGQALRERGHRVTFLVSEYFGPLLRDLGFDVSPVGEGSEFETIAKDPDLWHPRRGFAVVCRVALEAADVIYRRIEELNRPGETVAVGGSLALGVRLAREKLGVPSATVHLQPASIHTNYRTPVYAGLNTAWWPTWLKRAFFDVVYARMIDPEIAPGLNELRARLDLPPVRDVMRTWYHSPDLVLGFFPDWYGPSQPDWPRQVRLVGFPLYDERDVTAMPPGLEEFLAEGPPPIAFTPGSANIHGRPFFEAAGDACGRLGSRGLLLTRFAEQIPTDLPAGVRHFAYVPFSLLLPRVAALVHHGGIGTAAQGMAAGVPQLVMPLAHDQFDNAARMRARGVAREINPARFRGPRVARTLETLIRSPEVARSCREVAALFDRGAKPMEQAVDAIETIARGDVVQAAPGDRARN